MVEVDIFKNLNLVSETEMLTKLTVESDKMNI